MTVGIESVYDTVHQDFVEYFESTEEYYVSGEKCSSYTPIFEVY
jgi:hypothetical protein